MPPKRSKQSKDNASLTTPPLAAVVPLEKRGGRGVSARVLAVNQTQRSLRSLKKGVTFNVPDSASSVHNTETGGSVVKAGSANDTLDEPTGSNDQSDERMPESAPKNKTNKDSLTADTLAAPGTSINQSKPKSFQHKASPKSHLPTVAHKATSTRKKCEVIRLDLSESEDLDGKTADFDIEEDSCDDDSEESTDEDVPAKIIKQAIASNETGKRKDKKDPIDVKDFPIVIWMEVSDIERKIEVTSMWRIGDVRQKIADALVVGAQALKLAYKISVDKQQKKYRRLENQDDWDEIKRVGTAFRLAELRKKNGNPDNWGVSIKEEAGAPPAKQTKANDQKKAAINVAVPVTQPENTKMGMLIDYMTCESHSRRCCWITTEKDAASLAHYRIPIGTHINITDTEMWKWVEQWECGDADKRHPGHRLGPEICRRYAITQNNKKTLQDEDLWRRSIQSPHKTVLNKPPPRRVPSTPSRDLNFHPRPEATPHAVYSPFLGSQSANSNHWPPLGLMRNEEQILARVPLNLSATRALASPAAPVSAGTSDPPKECYFPIEEWLRRLDKERRVPNDTTVYEELADEFKKQGISSTYEIITLEVAGLMHVKGVTVGIAGKLVYWALKDSKGA